ncbi:MAG: serine protease [Treponema sp.]|nr:serine protease [Treponema sp.]
MNIRIFKKISFFSFAACAFALSISFFSCKSFSQPTEIQKPLDYTDRDVIENEIKNIRELQQKESTKALFRACLLGDDSIIEECAAVVKNQAQTALEENDYPLALRLYKSLVSAIKDEEAAKLFEQYSSDYNKNIPGLTVDEEKLPKTISDCINATVTVWVDQGYKVENGNGYADIVIGSGFFIDRRGYIITNHHVIAEIVNPKRKTTCKLFVKLPSDMEKKIPAKVVGYDSVMDLALLKVDSYEPDFVFALGSSSELEVGDKISAIGTPIGLEGTLTSGIISSTSRSLITMGNVFQIDAAVNAGNSGGPLIDSNRKVQAIVFAGMLQYQGLNFAIPVEYLKLELPLLYRGEELKHNWLGGFGHTKKIRNNNEGLEIQYVMPGGSASYTGLAIGDVIIRADDTPISSLDDFHNVCMKYDYGTIITCTYLRDGQEKEALLYLEKRPEAPAKEIYASDFVDDAFIPILGMKMLRSSTINKKSYRIEYVLEGSIADQNGFSENDNLELIDVSFDDKNKILYVALSIERRKKGLLNFQLGLGTSYDSPNYF